MLCNFIEITLRQGCSSVNLLHIFGTPSYSSIYEGLFLSVTDTGLRSIKSHSFQLRCKAITV